MIAAPAMATAPDDRTRLMDGYDSERVQRKKHAFGLLWLPSADLTKCAIVPGPSMWKPALLKHALTIGKEAARHLLQRPVVGVATAAHDGDGRWLLIRRADSGKWALVGGTMEWGERLLACAERELIEEAGARLVRVERIVGIYTDPARDPRFHAATIVLRCEIDGKIRGPQNPLEIREARFFTSEEVRAMAHSGEISQFSHGMGDMARAALTDQEPILE